MLKRAERQNTASDLAFVNLVDVSRHSGIDAAEYRAQQLATVSRTTPHVMAANVLAAGLICWVAWPTPVSAVALLWSACLTAVSMFVLVSRWLNTERRSADAPQARLSGIGAVRKVEFYAALFGALWGALPAATTGAAPPGVGFIIVGVSMAACGLGAFNLSRIPSAALIFGGIVISALAGSAFAFGARAGVAAILLGTIYGFALSAMILKAHALALQRASDQKMLEDHNDIIKLLLRDFESNTRDWMWECDASDTLRYVSERFVQLTGKEHSDVMGLTLREAVSAEDADETWAEIAALMQAHRPIESAEVSIAAGNDVTWWQINANPVYDDAQTFAGYRGVAVDMTDIRRSAEELVGAKQAAERASAAKSQFLAVMSHELRTPLNSIIGYAELATTRRHEPINEAERSEYIGNILEHAQHLSRLINDILDVSRIENGKMELVEQEVDLSELVDIIARMCKIQAREAAVELSETYEAKGLVVVGDLTRLRQILINMTSNAIKFTRAGGKVEIVVGLSDASAPQIRVVDTGIGIDPKKIDAVFEPFVQADESRTRQFEGAGLGLAISRRLARLHDGDIVLTSRPGKGTTAKLTLPAERLVKSQKPVVAA